MALLKGLQAIYGLVNALMTLHRLVGLNFVFSVCMFGFVFVYGLIL